MEIAQQVVKASRQLRDDVASLNFASPVTHVYNPLKYAWRAHEEYLQRMNPRGPHVLLLGMNPGPWGMAQTGVPFGQVAAVRDWLKITAPIGKPSPEHPKRPIQGYDCARSEVSGERLWGLMQQHFGTPAKFFRKHFVLNYCPLVFMEEGGRNRTPDKLPAEERAALTKLCDAHLAKFLSITEPEWLVGVGRYAEQCLKRVAPEHGNITAILHPSPASPAANRGWAEKVVEQLEEVGVW